MGCALLAAARRDPEPPPPAPAPSLPSPSAAAPTLDELRRLVGAANRARAVRHLQRYGPVQPDTTLLVLQARRDAPALARTLRSLRRVRDVDRALLVVSHARYDADVERALLRVDFCRVLQVYYPHSAQLHPVGYPGPEGCGAEDAADCGSRDPARLERKQHWWWTADLVLERLEWSRSYFGHAVFLDEGSVAVPDLLHVMRFLRRAAAAYTPRAALVALGGAGAGAADALLLRPWRPALTAAPALDRAAWARLAHLASFYCIYDDASWSRSLQRVLAQLPRGEALVLSPAAARVRVSAARGGRELRAHELFPQRMKARVWGGWEGAAPATVAPALPAGYISTPAPRTGQFADLRDQMMCLDSYMPTVSELDETPTATYEEGRIEVV